MRCNNEYRASIAHLMENGDINERLERLIENKSELTPYIVAMEHSRTGIFGYINNYLPHFAYAISCGYVPVVDMKNYKTIYQTNKENAWEKFFEQPCGLGLDEIHDKKAITCPTDLWYRWAPNSCPLMSDEEIFLGGKCIREMCYLHRRSENISSKRKCQTIITIKLALVVHILIGIIMNI